MDRRTGRHARRGTDGRTLDVPRSWAEVTPAWLGRALGLPVTDVLFTDLRAGTNASARATLRYADGPGRGPQRVFIKREGRLINRLALTALGAREAEAELATHEVKLPLEHPARYAAAVDGRRLAAIVVMEDVTLRGGTPNSAVHPLSVEQVAAGLRELAHLHAAYWQQPLPEFVRPWRLGAQWAPIAWGGFAHGLHTLRRLGRPLAVSPGEIERGFRGWAAHARRGPQTLLHGDPHPGNTYSLGPAIGFYDWQLVRSGSWAHDVGYFLVSSLAVADRRAHEHDLLAGYLGELGLPVGDAWQQYRQTPVFGLGSWLQTLAAGHFQPLDICLATIERFAAAYLELS